MNIILEQQTISYKTLNHINKDIKFLGLTSLQMMFLFVVVVFAFLIKIIAGIIILALSFFIISKLNSENKKGNIDFLGSFLTFNISPKTVIDNKIVLSFLIKN